MVVEESGDGVEIDNEIGSQCRCGDRQEQQLRRNRFVLSQKIAVCCPVFLHSAVLFFGSGTNGAAATDSDYFPTLVSDTFLRKGVEEKGVTTRVFLSNPLLGRKWH